MNFNSATLRLKGTPSEAGTYEMQYLVQRDYPQFLHLTIDVADAPYSPDTLADANSPPMIFNDNLFV